MRRAATRAFTLVSLIAIAALVCGGCGASAGGNNKVNDALAEALGFKSAEGSRAAPLSLGNVTTTGIVTHDGSVATGGLSGIGDLEDSYYLVSGIVPGVVYTVTLSGLSDDADLYVYQADPTFKISPATRVSTGTGTETFTVTAGPNVTSLFLGVDGFKTDRGATYALSVLVQPVVEGLIAAPVDLYQTPVLRAGSTVAYDPQCDLTACGATSGDSIYSITLQPGNGSNECGVAASPCPLTYLISLGSMTDDVDLYVFNDDGAVSGQLNFTGGTPNSLACTPSTQIGLAIETCLVTTPGSASSGTAATFLIDVDGHYSQAGAAFTINVIENPKGPLYEQYRTGPNDDSCDGYPCRMNNVNVPGTAELFISHNQSGKETATVKREQEPSQPIPGISGCTLTPITLGGVAAGGATLTALQSRDACFDSYYKADTVPGKNYRLAMDSATDTADLWVFGKDNQFATPICKPPYDRTDVQACTFTADATTVYFGVDGSHTAAGAAYTLSLLPAFVSQGTKASPLAVTFNATGLGTVSRDDVLGIGTDSDSYYMVSGLTPGNYIVSLPAQSDDGNLYVFGDDSTFTTPVCVPFQGGSAPENCVVNITGTTLYFAVDGYFTLDGGAYEYVVSSLASEGTSASPLSIGGAPAGYFGHVITATGTGSVNEDAVDSFYQVNVSAGKSYRVEVRMQSDDTGVPVNKVNLRVYQDQFISAPICSATENPSNHNTNCTAAANSGQLYFVIDGQPGTAPFTTYQISVQEDGSASSVAAIGLTGSVTNVLGQAIQPGGGPGAFGDPSDRYYAFSVNPAKHYRITLSNLTQDVDLYVFRSSSGQSFTANFLCSSTNRDTGSEVCEFINNHSPSDGQTITGGAGDTINIGVDGFPASGAGTFDLKIEEL